MELRICYFAAIRERLGAGDVVQVPDGTPVGRLWADVCAREPALAGLAVRFAVNEEYVDPTHVPRDGDEVAVFPPVSGGA